MGSVRPTFLPWRLLRPEHIAQISGMARRPSLPIGDSRKDGLVNILARNAPRNVDAGEQLLTGQAYPFSSRSIRPFIDKFFPTLDPFHQTFRPKTRVHSLLEEK